MAFAIQAPIRFDHPRSVFALKMLETLKTQKDWEHIMW